VSGRLCVAIVLLALSRAVLAEEALVVFDVEALAEGGAVVDFGSRAPASGIPPTVTLVSASGARVAHLIRRTQRCESLCGEMDAPTCHEAGLYRSADGTLPALPATAIPGRHEIEAVGAEFEERGGETESTLRSWISESFQPAPLLRGATLWLYRWQPGSRGSGVRLERRFGDGRKTFDAALYDPYPVKGCRLKHHETLTGLECPDEVWLYEGGTLVLHASTDGYGPGALELLARFTWQGVEHRLVVFAGKGYRSTALLRREGDRWSVFVPPKDYPFLC
jgi:hypothetical protein